jgi:hypothetical protein
MISQDRKFRDEILGYGVIAGGQMNDRPQWSGRGIAGSGRMAPSRQMTGGGSGGELERL